VLAALGLFKRQREVSVVLGPAEISQLSEAEPDDLVGQGVREV
jgi:hypothetical protein